MAKSKELQQYFAQSIAECFSTFMLILIGEASIAQYKFTGHKYHSAITINLSFGIGVYAGTELINTFSEMFSHIDLIDVELIHKAIISSYVAIYRISRDLMYC